MNWGQHAQKCEQNIKKDQAILKIEFEEMRNHC